MSPSETRLLDDGSLFVAFERAAFGTVVLALPPGHAGRSLVIHLGEKLNAEGKVPTPLGPVFVKVENSPRGKLTIAVDAPEGMSAEIVEPGGKEQSAAAGTSVRQKSTFGK